MKQLKLTSPIHQTQEKAFENWLETLGYSQKTVYKLPTCLREYFHYQELGNSKKLAPYFNYLSRRKKQNNQTGALSLETLKMHHQALKLYSKYLKQTDQQSFEVEIQLGKRKSHDQTVLTKSEVKTLYDATTDTLLGLRDRAMLGIYYGCGLRRNEGINLITHDVQLKQQRLYVRHGKQYKERYVPMTAQVQTDLETYLHYSRPALLKETKETSLFISERGYPIGDQSLYLRLKQLAEKAGIKQSIGLHTLRHSIATHLLKSGMSLEMIAHFLGHQSLESTQIYAHLHECSGG